MTSDERVAVLGTGLIGTSVAMAAAGLGAAVRGFDPDARTLQEAAERSGLHPAEDVPGAVEAASLVFVCAPVASTAAVAVQALRAAPDAVVTDVAGVKTRVILEVEAAVDARDRLRFVGGHPMGGSERSGPGFASERIVDGIVWVLCATPAQEAATERVAGFVSSLGARPIRIDAERHDRLVAFLSHLPQVASTALMDLAAAEESGEPEPLLLAAGGFRDLTRLAASDPGLWSEILLANAEPVAAALALYAERLLGMRDLLLERRGAELRAALARAKQARLSLATKPQIRAGVAVLQVPIPDRPGALAALTNALGEGSINIEDLQIVHSPEGGGGVVHLTVVSGAADEATRALRDRGLVALRLA